MQNFSIQKLIRQWEELLSVRSYRISLLSGVALVLVSLWVNSIASRYTGNVQALSVGDLVLDHIPYVNLSVLYRMGIFVIIDMLIAYPIFFAPEKAAFTAKTFAAFTLIRSFFISLTHIGAPELFYALPQATDQNALIGFFYLNDLFFSAHTGIPFLAALIFWDNRFMRWFMLSASVVMGATVLFMHVHYSIDVFGAYFITYTIFIVSDRVFNKLNLHFRTIVENVEKEERLLFRMLRNLKKSD